MCVSVTESGLIICNNKLEINIFWVALGDYAIVGMFNTREGESIEESPWGSLVRVTRTAIFSLYFLLFPSSSWVLAQSESPSCISSTPSSSSSIGAGAASFSMPGGSGSFGKANGTEEVSPSLDRFSSGPSDAGLDLAVTGLAVATGLFGAVFSLGLS